ncbi:uncharacterized protein BX664DRAFT_329970 [Halteromyces radiatus]|uniref:uncharacterized protein n=1 Tax=Halteromyces radiatus TaxID=101107 RepID=UPI002220EBF4|nr:uncharacterized protein BX664DRAFT_329970 [Halteromyces radiatus]KAI8093557.1 hypothetical protein BX664DRAFT_329970 [Halteromyces radiatus]
MDKWLQRQPKKQPSGNKRPSPQRQHDLTLESRKEPLETTFLRDMERAKAISLTYCNNDSLDTSENTQSLKVQRKPSSKRVLEPADTTWDVDTFVDGLLTSGVRVNPSLQQQVDQPRTAERKAHVTTEDKDEWEPTYDPETDTVYEVATTGHDSDAEALFWGQFRRERWHKQDIQMAHDAAKKKSMVTAIKKNKRIKTNSTFVPNNHYVTSDDVLENDFEASGFGDSVAGLTWEGIGQSRYA